METECILSDYLEQAMEVAVYDKLDDGTFAGRIPPCKGVLAFGATLRECERLLRSTLEDWLLLGLTTAGNPSNASEFIPRPAASCPPSPDPSEKGRRGFR